MPWHCIGSLYWPICQVQVSDSITRRKNCIGTTLVIQVNFTKRSNSRAKLYQHVAVGRSSCHTLIAVICVSKHQEPNLHSPHQCCMPYRLSTVSILPSAPPSPWNFPLMHQKTNHFLCQALNLADFPSKQITSLTIFIEGFISVGTF